MRKLEKQKSKEIMLYWLTKPNIKMNWKIIEYFMKTKANGEEWTQRLITTLDGEVTDTTYNEAFGLPLVIKQGKDQVTQEPNGKYRDTMKIRIPVSKEGKLLCDFFDKDGEYIQDISVLQRLKRGAKVSMILECSGIYFSSGKFGYTAWQVFQCRIKQDAQRGGVPRGKCLVTDSDDEGEYSGPAPVIQTEEPPQQVPPEATSGAKKVVRKKK